MKKKYLDKSGLTYLEKRKYLDNSAKTQLMIYVYIEQISSDYCHTSP